MKNYNFWWFHMAKFYHITNFSCSIFRWKYHSNILMESISNFYHYTLFTRFFSNDSLWNVSPAHKSLGCTSPSIIDRLLNETLFFFIVAKFYYSKSTSTPVSFHYNREKAGMALFGPEHILGVHHWWNDFLAGKTFLWVNSIVGRPQWHERTRALVKRSQRSMNNQRADSNVDSVIVILCRRRVNFAECSTKSIPIRNLCDSH